MNNLQQLKKETLVLNKKIERLKTHYALVAAHYHQMSFLNSHLVKNPTTLEQAQGVAKLVNSIYQENKSAFDFIERTDDVANNSIEYYNAFKTWLDNYPFDKKSLESFCKYYANTGWPISLLKCQINYILYIGLAIQEYSLGKITEQQMFEMIDETIKTGERFFSFKPRRVLRSFAEAKLKLNEIEDKIDARIQKAK